MITASMPFGCYSVDDGANKQGYLRVIAMFIEQEDVGMIKNKQI